MFWFGFEDQDTLAPAWRPCPFPCKTHPKNQNQQMSIISRISQVQSIDKSIRVFIQNFIEIGQKWLSHGQKTYAWFYEFKFVSALDKSDFRRALKLSNTFRLIDDISTLNSDGTF